MEESRGSKGGTLPGNATSTSTSNSPTLNSTANDHIETDEKAASASIRSSHSSSSSHDSADSDPLSPLERAMTPSVLTEAEQMENRDLTHTRTATSFATTGSRIPSFEVDFTENDSNDPRTWPLWYKGLTMFAVSFSTWVVVLYSTSYTSSMPGMMEEFGEDNEAIATLGVTFYLVGLAAGSLVLAPLSEIYGRRPVYIGSLLFFAAMVLPCALATSLPEILIVRFFGYDNLFWMFEPF